MEIVFGLALLGLLITLYLLPTIIAHMAKHHQELAIFLLNFFLGWSLIGWVIALVWACMKPAPQQHIHIHQEPPPSA